MDEKSFESASKVKIECLSDGKDFKHWKYRIRNVLKGYPDALKIIDGTLKVPIEPKSIDSTETRADYEKKLKEFQAKDSLVLTLLTNNMTNEVLDQVMRFETAKEVWDELERLYCGCAEEKSYDLCLQFFSYNKDPEHDIKKHISALKNIWHELNNQIQAKLPDILLICKILGTLPKNFFAFKSSWLLVNKKDRTIENLTAQLSTFEKALKSNEEVSEYKEEVLVVKTEKTKDKGAIFKCKYCGLAGHRVRKCRKWIEDGRPPKPSCSKTNVNLTVLAVGDKLPIDDKNWYVDNGATSHVTHQGDIFESFEHFDDSHNVTVTAANGQTIEAIGKGNIRAVAKCNGKVEQLLLKDVWYVPQIKRNLFSVLATHNVSSKSTFESTPKQCILKVDGVIKAIGTRKIDGGLYKLDINCIRPNKLEVNQLLTNPLQLYHERLVHQNKRHVKQVIETELGVKINNNKSDLCEGCIYGKTHRLQFGTRTRATQPGELVHTDICGPFPTSYGKNRYYILFKDDYTRHRHVYFLKQKSEAASKLRQFLAAAKVAGHTVKEVLSDYGGEFVSAEFKRILQERGITQRLTMPYTHEQAGCVERENRTIVEAARAIMHARVKIPEKLWAEVIEAVVYVLDRTGPSSVPNKSPYELWFGKKPSIKHLRILGCKCYAHVPKANRKKLEKKAELGILVGYEGSEGYRIWNKEKSKLTRSRDVTFDERPLLEKPAEDDKIVSLKPITSKEWTFPWIQHVRDESIERNANDQRHEDNPESRKDQSDIHLNDNEPSSSRDVEYIDVDDQEDDNLIQSENANSDQNYETAHSDNEEEEPIEEPANNLNLNLSNNEIEREGQRTLRDRSKLRPPDRFKDYVMAVEANSMAEPKTYKEAMNSSEREKWLQAIDSEINSLKDNKTWELVELPKGRKAIPCKWIFKIKTNADGTIEKYKARLVIKGYSQKKDIDFHETFSPVARSSTIRAVLSVAAKEKLSLAQFDVSTAFLYGTLNEEIYMKPPEGYANDKKLVFKLKKSLYGLKQAPLCWNRCITDYIVQIGFNQSKSDPCLFTRKRGGERIILALYVDDGLIASTSEKETTFFLEEMKKRFKLTTKPATYFLGMEIERQSDGSILLHQKAYANRVLERFGMEECKPVATPILKAEDMKAMNNDQEVKVSTFPYRQAVGALAYLMTGTRPDIAYAVSVVSRNLNSPTKDDVQIVKRIMRYIKGTIDHGIKYTPDCDADLKCYSDADHGGDANTGRSTSGILCMFAGGAISWNSKRQNVVAISSTEAEIYAASETAREIIWLKRILKDITGDDCHAYLCVDNESAIKIAKNPPEFHQRTKHIRLRAFFIRDCIQEGNIDIRHVNSEKQIADMLTKSLYGPRIKELKILAGVSTFKRGGC